MMLSRNLSVLAKRVLIVGVVSALLVCTGVVSQALHQDVTGSNRTSMLGSMAVYAADQDYVSTVIEDQTLAQVVRMLAYYSSKNSGKSLYDLIKTDAYKDQYQKYGERITDYADLVKDYDKPVTQIVLEDYNDMIDLWQYPEITDLTGINNAIRVTEVITPPSLTTVEGKTFSDMLKLKFVAIPDTVTSIGDGAFEKCESLTSLVIYDDKTSALVGPADGSGNLVANVIYLKGISSIGNSAFNSCKGMKKVDFGTGDVYVSIDSNAFTSCTSLSDVKVPRGSLGTGVFSSCHSLNTIVFDDSYIKIPNNTLADINGDLAITFPASLQEIGAYACRGDNIKATNLSSCKDLRTISEYAFQNTEFKETKFDLSTCAKLETIERDAFAGSWFAADEVKLPDSMKNMGSAAFRSASGFTTINIPSSMNLIPAGAFMNCYDLKTIKKGDNITEIGAHAFDLCGHLDYEPICTNMKKLTKIGDYAFARCVPDKDEVDTDYGLKNFTIRDTVTEVGASAFENDFKLTGIAIGSGVKGISDRFLICENKTSPTWEDVTLTDPISGKETTYPFKSSSEPGYVNLRDRYSYKSKINEMSMLTRVTTEKDKDSITSIGDYAFFGCTSLMGFTTSADTILLPRKLTSIGKYAFAECSRRTGSGKDMQYYGMLSVDMPDTVVTIGEYAFNNDYSLEYVKLPDILEEIPAHCFDGCGYDNSYWDNNVNIHSYQGLTYISDISKVTRIGEYAFNKCWCLKQCKVQKGTSTSYYDIEFGRRLESLGKYAFAETDIRSASSLLYSSIDKIDVNTFDGCRDLTSVYCPDTVTSIGDYSFRNCPKLATMDFPVYATLSATMIAKNMQQITLTPSLGRYLNTRFKVPIVHTITLPSNAFARRQTDKISQVYVDGPNAGKDVELDQADPKYFDVAFTKNEYLITGGANEVKGTAVRISATIPFTDSSSRTMSIEYPVDVIKTHADQSTMEFDASKIKIGGSPMTTIFEKDGELCLYVNKSKIGSTLTLVLDAQSTEKDYPGIITDDAAWTSTSAEGALALKEDSVTKVTGSDKTTTTATFDIKSTGFAVIAAAFDNESTSSDPTKTIRVEVIEPIKNIDFTLSSTGEDHKNMSSLQMPVGQADAIIAVPTYTNEEDKRDFLTYKSSDPAIVSVDNSGRFIANDVGKATITIRSATESTRRDLYITVCDKGTYVAPLFVSITGPMADSKGQVYCNETSCFKAKCLPAYASQAVTWSIGSTTDATLEEKGGDAYLTGVNANMSFTLNAKATDGTTAGSASANLTVMTYRRADSVEFREMPPIIGAGVIKNMTLSSNENQQNGVIRTPADSWEGITFTSSDPTLLTVGSSSTNCTAGSVTLSGNRSTLYYIGFRNGTATITATTTRGDISVLVVTIVEAPIQTITVTENPIYLLKGKSAKVKYTFTPSFSTDQVRFETSNEKVATVDATSGKVTAASVGTAYVTLRSTVNNRTTSCTINVLGKGQTLSQDYVTYTVNKDQTFTYTSYYGSDRKITVPSTIKVSGNSYKVTKIANNASQWKTLSTKLVIGTNITQIGQYAYSYCSGLKTVQIKSKKIKKIGRGAFSNCREGMTIKVPRSKYKAYKKMLTKSGLPARTKIKKA